MPRITASMLSTIPSIRFLSSEEMDVFLGLWFDYHGIVFKFIKFKRRWPSQIDHGLEGVVLFEKSNNFLVVRLAFAGRVMAVMNLKVDKDNSFYIQHLVNLDLEMAQALMVRATDNLIGKVKGTSPDEFVLPLLGLDGNVGQHGQDGPLAYLGMTTLIEVDVGYGNMLSHGRKAFIEMKVSRREDGMLVTMGVDGLTENEVIERLMAKLRDVSQKPTPFSYIVDVTCCVGDWEETFIPGEEVQPFLDKCHERATRALANRSPSGR